MQLTNIRQIKAAPAFLGSQHFLPPISPLSKKGKRKEKKYLKRKRDPSCLEGFYQVKYWDPINMPLLRSYSTPLQTPTRRPPTRDVVTFETPCLSLYYLTGHSVLYCWRDVR